MRLVAGLGNPGSSYGFTRHNVGFMVLDHLAKQKGLIFNKKKLYEAVAQHDFILIKPRTFMNRSGQAITSVLSSFSVTEMLVIFDDASLPFGCIRFRHNGGTGGHNGLKSIQTDLGSTDFKRFRLGIGAPEPDQDLADFVLSNFSSDEAAFLPEMLSYAAKLIDLYLLEGFEYLLDYHSKNKKPYSEKLAAFQDHKSKGGI
ncbi:MAG: aminoacyl-tRNA hydrolase [Candidatus Cloacimonetes bacterium]|nr:aminoacyl-tRNA hydrolase [Candidatus Cloacimonadota bacterium]